MSEKKPNKAQQLKDGWIKETQSFQQKWLTREHDSYETLAAEYDKDFVAKKKQSKPKKIPKA